ARDGGPWDSAPELPAPSLALRVSKPKPLVPACKLFSSPPLRKEKLSIPVGKAECLAVRPPITDCALASCSHLRGSRYCHPRNGADTNSDIHWRQVTEAVLLNIVPDLLFKGGKCSESQLKLFRHPDPWEIFVTRSITEPAPHLKQGVVLIRRAEEKADHQPFESKAACQDRSTDDDVCFGRSCVINPIVACPVFD